MKKFENPEITISLFDAETVMTDSTLANAKAQSALTTGEDAVAAANVATMEWTF